MDYFDHLSNKKIKEMAEIQSSLYSPKKDEELNIENAELALQLLLSGSTSEKIDCVKVACGALRYYIEKEELWSSNRIKRHEEILSMEEIDRILEAASKFDEEERWTIFTS